jgi:hypothetical protein
MRHLVFCALVLFAVAGAARASPVQDAARRFGLIGRWADDCAAPASQTDEWATYSRAADGTLALAYDSGPGVNVNRYVWRNGARTPDGDLRLDGVFLGNGLAQHTVLRKNARGQLITWSNVDGSGRVLVENGRFPGGGSPPWMTRCGR